KAAVTIAETMALAAMEPTPTNDTARRAIRGPKMASRKKLKNGMAGMMAVSWSTLSPHLAGAVGIEHPMLVIKAEKQRQPDRHLRRSHGQNEQEHHLTISLHPMRARGDEG